MDEIRGHERPEPAPERSAELSPTVEEHLARGLQFANLLGSVNQEQTAANTLLLQSLVELLIAKGVVHIHELEERKKALAEAMDARNAEAPRVHLVEAPDKYAPEHSVPVDCASRIDVCRMVCCKLWFALSVQDLTEGIVRWNYGMPYSIAQGEDGFCVHLEHGRGCGIYANRPLVCRSYDCRNDGRIWEDFERKVLSDQAIKALSGLAPGKEVIPIWQ